MPRPETEHSPLSPFDEYPIHQTPDPIRVVATTDGRAHDRYWFTAQDLDGDFFLVVGYGVYPNQDTVDGYAILVRDGRHTTVRFHRPLGDDRGEISCGPFSAEPVEPFREWRLTLGENPMELSFDLRWRDTKRAVFGRMLPPPGHPMVRNGRPAPVDVGYESFGRVSGEVRLGDLTLSLDPERTIGSRDHHWGHVNGVGGPGLMEAESSITHLGQWVEFEGWSIWGPRVLYDIGSEHPGTGHVVNSQHAMWFDEETKHLRGGVIENLLDDGRVKTIRYEPIEDLVAYLRCGMYHGPQGGTPNENLYHGMAVGDDLHVGGETFDLTDPAVRIRIAGFEDHLCRASCDGETTIGVLETKNPLLYEMCEAGLPGFEFGTPTSG